LVAVIERKASEDVVQAAVDRSLAMRAGQFARSAKASASPCPAGVR
jgi:hypothetical protein